MLCDSVLEEECQKVLLHSINGHLRSSLFYDYLLVSDVLDINDLLDTRSLGMYSACMAPHFPALLCSVYRHCSFPRCYTSHCVCPSLNCVFPTALCCAQITSVVSNNRRLKGPVICELTTLHFTRRTIAFTAMSCDSFPTHSRNPAL